MTNQEIENRETIFFEALRHVDPAEREAYIDSACGANTSLREETLSLLRSYEDDEGVLQVPVELFEATSSNMGDVLGTTIDRYKLLKRIGEGGMALVYQAEQEKPLHRQVAFKVIKPGIKLGLIGYTIQQYVEKHGFGVVRELVGHGIGRNVHEEPAVPNYGSRNSGITLQAGMVIAIEPMVTQGDYRVNMNRKDWVVKTLDGSLSAHYEHTVAVTEKGPRILT